MPGLQPPKKLGGYDFFHKVLGSPKYVVAPMVDQSELVSHFSSHLHSRILMLQNFSPGGYCPENTVLRFVPHTVSIPYVIHCSGTQLVYTPMIHAKVRKYNLVLNCILTPDSDVCGRSTEALPRPQL